MDDTLAAALACLAARFSLRDFPDFLAIVCRGDLSDIAGPLIMGAWLVPMPRAYPRWPGSDVDIGLRHFACLCLRIEFVGAVTLLVAFITEMSISHCTLYIRPALFILSTHKIRIPTRHY